MRQKSPKLRSGRYGHMAEGAGFEPARPFGPAVFKTAAFNHSATPPWLVRYIIIRFVDKVAIIQEELS